jgi:hypothetical protein
MVRLLEFITFDPKAVNVMPLDTFKRNPVGLWLIIQDSLPFSWLNNCLNQHDPSRKNIKTTNDLFDYIAAMCKQLKDQEIIAKETENMFTGTSADQQRKDANIARYPPRSNLHAIKDSSEMPSKHDPIYVPLQEPILDDVDDSEEAHGLVPT